MTGINCVTYYSILVLEPSEGQIKDIQHKNVTLRSIPGCQYPHIELMASYT